MARWREVIHGRAAALTELEATVSAVQARHDDVLSIDLVGDAAGVHGPDWGATELARRLPRPDLAPDPALPAT